MSPAARVKRLRARKAMMPRVPPTTYGLSSSRRWRERYRKSFILDSITPQRGAAPEGAAPLVHKNQRILLRVWVLIPGHELGLWDHEVRALDEIELANRGEVSEPSRCREI